jgi:hypothetical protein
MSNAAIPSILDPNWKYTPSSSTDIRQTYKKHGFKSPTKTKKGNANVNHRQQSTQGKD